MFCSENASVARSVDLLCLFVLTGVFLTISGVWIFVFFSAVVFHQMRLLCLLFGKSHHPECSLDCWVGLSLSLSLILSLTLLPSLLMDWALAARGAFGRPLHG